MNRQRLINLCLGVSLAVWSTVIALLLLVVAGVRIGDPDFGGLFASSLAFGGLLVWLFARVAFDVLPEGRALDEELAAHRRVFPTRPAHPDRPFDRSA
ncbi:MAG: hypothetical protein AAF333_13215 [Planctomycetota bacterium]